jgi:hypothetical protein
MKVGPRSVPPLGRHGDLAETHRAIITSVADTYQFLPLSSSYLFPSSRMSRAR